MNSIPNRRKKISAWNLIFGFSWYLAIYEIQRKAESLFLYVLNNNKNITVEEDELNSSTEKEGVEIFFFPDESNMKLKQPTEIIDTDVDKSIDYESFPMIQADEDIKQDVKPTNSRVARDLGDPTSTPKSTPRKSKRKKVI